MKFTSTQENLNQGLSIVSHLASKTTTLPILNNILIKAENGLLTLISTNLEIGINYQARSKIEKDGIFTVQSKVFTDFINFLPKGNVEVEVKEEYFHITSGNYKTKIKGIDPEEFPLIPKVAQDKSFICSAEDFVRALEEVIFAASANETRPEIAGVYFKFSAEKKLIMAATDSYRLAETKVDLNNDVQEEKEVILPIRTLQEIIRIVNLILSQEEAEEKDIKIFFEDNQVLFKYNNFELVSRIVEGQYPDYTQIIPTEFKNQATLRIKELANAIKSSSLFSKAGVYDVTLEFQPNGLKVYSSNNQLGENQVDLEAKTQGSGKIVLNYKYLLEGLGNLKTGQVVLKINDPESPCLLRPVEEIEGKELENDNYLYIIMPIKQ